MTFFRGVKKGKKSSESFYFIILAKLKLLYNYLFSVLLLTVIFIYEGYFNRRKTYPLVIALVLLISLNELITIIAIFMLSKNIIRQT